VSSFSGLPADKVAARSWQALKNNKVVFIPGLLNRMTCTVFNGLFRYLANKRKATPARAAAVTPLYSN